MQTHFPKSWDVLIVGGGPAGLATAIAARRHGLSVLVADGAIPPIDKPCGEGLMPDGVEALRRLGIAIPEGEAYPFRGIRFLSDGQKAEAEFPRGSACGIRRTNLHRIMLDHAASCGVRMLWQAAVTGLHAKGALVAGELVRARWVVGADGTSSRVRHWAKLDSSCARRSSEKNRRFAFRRHYRVAPWTEFMELHWGNRKNKNKDKNNNNNNDCQIYVTPVGWNEVCVALISASPKLRLEDALPEFPELSAHLQDAPYASTERGAITVTRRFRRVYRDRIALVGDASGAVDAITGEGLCLTFQQAALLGDCLASDDLARYQRTHRALLRRPAFIAHMMLSLSRRARLRQRTMQVFRSHPESFARMLAMHVGEGSAHERISNGISLGWQLLTA